MTFKKTKDQQKLTKLLAGPHTRILAHGGSRSGKTFGLIRAICVRASKAPGSRHLITRFHFRDAKIAIFMDTLPKVLSVCFPDLKKNVEFNRTDFYVKFPNKSEIWIGGLDDKERTEKILGLEYTTIYFNEASQISFGSVQTALTRLAQKCPEIRNKAYFDCNPPRKKHWLYKLFFIKIDPDTKKALKNPESYVEIQMNPEGNKENLSEGYIEETLETLTDQKRARFLEGKWLDDVEGAAWKRAWIDNTRVVSVPELYRIVVGVDPAGTHNKKSNSTGIVVAGVDATGHYYIIADRTVNEATPEEWGTAVVNAYREFKADKVIGETNYGGDLVERNIKVCDSTVPFDKVTASRGKIVRAEPISALFQKGYAHIVGEFPELEDEMCNYSPLMQAEEKIDSPDHMDAMVWAVTSLVEGHHPGEPIPGSWCGFGGAPEKDPYHIEPEDRQYSSILGF